MGLRDRFKKRVAKAIGRDSQSKEASEPTAPKAPPPSKRPRASYRTHTPSPEPAAVGPTPEPDPAPVEVAKPMPIKAEAAKAPAPEAKAPPAEQASPPAEEVPMEKRAIDMELTYTVRLFNKDEGLDTEIQVFDGEFVLDAADRCAVDLPSSCRNGGCTVCAGRLMSGTMDMEDQYVLEEEHIEDGFVLLCCAVVTSDAVIETHQDEVVA